MVLIWVYLFPLCVLAKSEQTWHTKLQAATGQTWHKHLFKYSRSVIKIIILLHSSPQICFFPSISYSSPQFAVPCRPEWMCSCFDCDPWAFWAARLPTGALCQSSGRATVAWACAQPKINSLYGHCFGAWCEDTLFSKFSLEMQILFLMIYFSIEREKNDPKQF